MDTEHWGQTRAPSQGCFTEQAEIPNRMDGVQPMTDVKIELNGHVEERMETADRLIKAVSTVFAAVASAFLAVDWIARENRGKYIWII